jgi:ADP-ribose diphosphatase
MDVIEHTVEFSSERTEIYHAVGRANYIAIVALTPTGSIPIVRQFRPAIEAFSWELPAGLVDHEEAPIESCRRELLAETGFHARAIHHLGATSPCTGRLSNQIHNFFVEAGQRAASYKPESGLTLKLVSPVELVHMIGKGEFISQLHLGALFLAKFHSFFKLPRS